MMEDREVGLYNSTPPLQQITTGPQVESAASCAIPCAAAASRTGHTAPPPSENGRSSGNWFYGTIPRARARARVTAATRASRCFRRISVTGLWPPTIYFLHSHNSIFSPSAHVRKMYTKSMCPSTHTGSCAPHLLGKECYDYIATMGVSRLVQGP